MKWGNDMNDQHTHLARVRTRWSAIGAAIAITLGGGGIGLAQASVSSGDKPVTVTVDARRILDTRTNVGLAGGFAKDTPREVQVTGSVDVVTDTGTTKETVVPAGASAVLVNVTVVFPTDQGFLTLRAGGATGAPKTSTVNFAANSVEPNAATVDLSADGKIQVWVFMPSATAKADVLIDVVGYTTDHNHDDRYYTEGEVDSAVAAAVAPKANSADVYTKTQVDAAVAPKANSADVYTKTEADAAHATKANSADVYTKAEVDTAVANVARVAGVSFLSAPFLIVNNTIGNWPTPLCPVGQLAIAGGMDTGINGDNGTQPINVSSFPTAANGNRNWTIQFRNATGADLNATVYTVCAEIAP